MCECDEKLLFCRIVVNHRKSLHFGLSFDVLLVRSVRLLNTAIVYDVLFHCLIAVQLKARRISNKSMVIRLTRTPNSLSTTLLYCWIKHSAFCSYIIPSYPLASSHQNYHAHRNVYLLQLTSVWTRVRWEIQEHRNWQHRAMNDRNKGKLEIHIVWLENNLGEIKINNMNNLPIVLLKCFWHTRSLSIVMKLVDILNHNHGNCQMVNTCHCRLDLLTYRNFLRGGFGKHNGPD